MGSTLGHIAGVATLLGAIAAVVGGTLAIIDWGEKRGAEKERLGRYEERVKELLAENEELPLLRGSHAAMKRDLRSYQDEAIKLREHNGDLQSLIDRQDRQIAELRRQLAGDDCGFVHQKIADLYVDLKRVSDQIGIDPDGTYSRRDRYQRETRAELKGYLAKAVECIHPESGREDSKSR